MLKVVNYAPCTIANPLAFSGGNPVEASFLINLFALQIYSFGGPNWGDRESGDLGTLCAVVGEPFCSVFEAVEQGFPIKLFIHGLQMAETESFQEYIEPQLWLAGVREAPLYDVSSINQIPFDWFAHTTD